MCVANPPPQLPWHTIISHYSLAAICPTSASVICAVNVFFLVVVGPEWAGLWEDGMLMGFMPLKAEVSTETSLATPSLFKLTSEVSGLISN